MEVWKKQVWVWTTKVEKNVQPSSLKHTHTHTLSTSAMTQTDLQGVWWVVEPDLPKALLTENREQDRT